MAFLGKSDVERFASAAHLDLSGMTWQQKQSAINDYAKRNGFGDASACLKHMDGDMKAGGDADGEDEIARLKRELDEAKSAVPQVPVVFERGRANVEPDIKDYENVVLIASPEQRPTQFQRGKYYENVGIEKITTDISYGVGRDAPFGSDEYGVRSSTYKVEEGSRPIMAESTMPKYSALLTYRPTKDLVAVAEYGGHRGYLWTHHRLPNVKGLLDMMGAYDEYKDQWKKGTGRLFYLGGLICCDISFTESMIKRIQRQLKKRDESDLL